MISKVISISRVQWLVMNIPAVSVFLPNPEEDRTLFNLEAKNEPVVLSK